MSNTKPTEDDIFGENKAHWLSEKNMIIEEAKKFTENGLYILQHQVGTGKEFEKLADVFVDTCKIVYNEKLNLASKKYINSTAKKINILLTIFLQYKFVL